MTDLYDRIMTNLSNPLAYEPLRHEELLQLAELYNVAKVEIAPALRREMMKLPYTEETQDLYDTLDACAEDLVRLTT